MWFSAASSWDRPAWAPVLRSPLRAPIAFDAIDGHPVDVVFVLLLPASPGPEHLRALASVARTLRDPELVRQLRGARTGAQAHQSMIDGGR
jgi:mannitol/fructose-specific phosphotransferase system IIA component (Ntr-type)